MPLAYSLCRRRGEWLETESEGIYFRDQLHRDRERDRDRNRDRERERERERARKRQSERGSRRDRQKYGERFGRYNNWGIIILHHIEFRFVYFSCVCVCVGVCVCVVCGCVCVCVGVVEPTVHFSPDENVHYLDHSRSPRMVNILLVELHT